ncbi:MAG: M48 family metallopeptidase [Anaerolineae bacterium]
MTHNERSETVAEEALGPDAERQAKAQAYAHIRRRLLVLDLGISAVLTVAFLTTGASQAYKDLLLRVGLESPWQLVPAYTGSLILAYTVLFWPLSWYSSYVLPHRYGLSTQTPKGWWTDELKSLALSLGLSLPVAEVVYWFLRSEPETWWLWVAGFLVVLSVVMGYLLPVVFVPIFYTLTRLEDERLVARIRRLAERAGVQVADVYTIDLSSRTTAANAMVMGMGNTKRIALGDTLYENYSPEEIEAILAHELAHQVHHDLELGVLVQSALLVGGLYLAKLFLDWGVDVFGFTGPGDVAALPLLALATGLFSLVTMPLTNGYSRWRERMADAYALRMTDDPHAFARSMLRLADQNLAELRPPDWVVWLLYSHPPILERVERAIGAEAAQRLV